MKLQLSVSYALHLAWNEPTRRTSFSCRSKTCVTKLRCVRNHWRAMAFAIPLSCSAIYPMLFPCASIITYLLACSKPLPVSVSQCSTCAPQAKTEFQGCTHIMTFIISNCRWTTNPELARMPDAGCLSFSTPLGSSGRCTGESSVFCDGS